MPKATRSGRTSLIARDGYSLHFGLSALRLRRRPPFQLMAGRSAGELLPRPIYTEGVIRKTESKTPTPYFRRERPYLRELVNPVVREARQKASTLRGAHEVWEAC